MTDTSTSGTVSVPRELRSVLGLILNALDRDAEQGKAVRGEMAQELRAILAQPAEQQDEAAGFATFRDGRYGSWLHSSEESARSHDSTAIACRPANSEIVPLYRHPAAQAVKLPEHVYAEIAKDPAKCRRTSPENVADVIDALSALGFAVKLPARNRDYLSDWAAGWNACLDAVAKLNGIEQ